MRKWAEEIGKVAIVKLLRNKKTQKSTGCGFVAFEKETADAAVDKAFALAAEGKVLIGGREVRVKYARKAPRPTFTDNARPGQDARLGKGVTPSSAALSAAAAAAGARLKASAPSGAGGLAEKIRLRQLQAAKWNGEPAAAAGDGASPGWVIDTAPAVAEWKPISADVGKVEVAADASKADKRSARDKKRAEAFHARKLHQA